MPYCLVANRVGREIWVVICDYPPEEHPHHPALAEHRRYRWDVSEPDTGPEEAVREILRLEALRLGPDAQLHEIPGLDPTRLA